MRQMDEESKKRLAIYYLTTNMIISIKEMEAHTRIINTLVNDGERLMISLGVLNVLTHIDGDFDLSYPIVPEEIVKRFKDLQEKNRINGLEHISICWTRDRTLIVNDTKYVYRGLIEMEYLCRYMLSILEDPNSVSVFWDDTEE